jgi:hypothetical protein
VPRTLDFRAKNLREGFSRSCRKSRYEGWPTTTTSTSGQGCHMANFQNLGNFWRGFPWKMLVYFTAIWNILQPFGIFCGHLEYFEAILNILWPFGIFCSYLVYFMVIWYIIYLFGMLHQEKSGNSASGVQFMD